MATYSRAFAHIGRQKARAYRARVAGRMRQPCEATASWKNPVSFGETHMATIAHPATTIQENPLHWQRTCALIADTLSEDARNEPGRLAKGLVLAQTHRVQLIHPDDAAEEDDYASVQSGKVTYTLSSQGQCECQDFKKREGEPCKHLLALQIYEGALAQPAPLVVNESPPAPVVAPASIVRTIDNPAGANFKARIGNMELWYMWHGATDAEIMQRMRESLPMLQDLVQACEARQKEREAEQAAARAPQAPLTIDPAVQHAIAEAVKQALAVHSLPKSTRNGQRPPIGGNDTDASWCERHNVSMDHHPANDRGPAWYSHRLASGGYCKGDN